MVLCSNSKVARLIEKHNADASQILMTLGQLHEVMLDRNLASIEWTSIMVISQDDPANRTD